MSVDELGPEELRSLIGDAQAALAKIMAEEAARAAATKAVTEYANTTGVTVAEAWAALAPVPEPAPEPITAPDWALPTTPENAYNIGDRVTYQGAVYEAIRDAIMWSPNAYPMGWRKL